MHNIQLTQSYRQLAPHFYSDVIPESLIDSRIVHQNHRLQQDLDIEIADQVLKSLTDGTLADGQPTPLAQKYTGHQFGYYNPDLGDGRGVLLGQIKDAQQTSWDLHLKGCGQTPYSRRGDGRAVLRSAVREYLIGEALHFQGIASSRCLAINHSPEPVYRETIEERASYIRVARTHIRFGHFEYAAHWGKADDFHGLLDYTIATVYPELRALEGEDKIMTFLETVAERTGKMIAQWQSAGFCHGVMNTDNMSIAGETFDFGPYAFQDNFNIHYICNHSDTEGRYAYSQQPNIGLWNVKVLANAFSRFTQASREDLIEFAGNKFIDAFNHHYLQNMGHKFGIANILEEDRHFIADSLILLDQTGGDFHHFFRSLTQLQREPSAWLQGKFDSKAWKDWSKNYLSRVDDFAQSSTLIQQNTPKLILRNYIAQEAIAAAETEDYSLVSRLMHWLRNPYEIKAEQLEEKAYYLEQPSECQRGLTLSCSS